MLAAAGYPGSPRSGDPVDGVGDAEALQDVHVLHAGTRTAPDGTVVSAGGRVLSVVGTGSDVAAAREAAYRGVARIRLDGEQHRTDIAASR